MSALIDPRSIVIETDVSSAEVPIFASPCALKVWPPAPIVMSTWVDLALVWESPMTCAKLDCVRAVLPPPPPDVESVLSPSEPSLPPQADNDRPASSTVATTDDSFLVKVMPRAYEPD